MSALKSLAFTTFVFWSAVCGAADASQPWVRFAEPIEQLEVSPNGQFVAYVSKQELKVLNLATHEIYQVTKFSPAHQSFFWPPAGYRLFYLENQKKNDVVLQHLKAFQVLEGKHEEIKQLDGGVEFVAFNPANQKMTFYTPSKKQMESLSVEFFSHNIQHATSHNRWAVTSKQIHRLDQAFRSHLVFTAKGEDILFFDISSDNEMIAWQTSAAKVYVAGFSSPPKLLDRGLEPKWHPQTRTLLYTGVRMLGSAISEKDIKTYDFAKNESTWLTQTNGVHERWPRWKGKDPYVMFTKERTTDLFAQKINLTGTRLSLKH